MARVLVVDDDPALLRALRLGLASKGHEVTVAATGEGGIAKVATESPEVVILDLGLPDIDGLEVCRRVRQWSEVPIIVLSAIGLEGKKVTALDSGADDYMTKPFGMAELEARIRTALRHQQANSVAEPDALVAGLLRLDLVHRQGEFRGETLELTTKEFDLLVFLARHAGKVCTHEMILRAVWGGKYGREAESLRVYVSRLRRKLGDPDGTFLRTTPGVGYELSANDSQG